MLGPPFWRWHLPRGVNHGPWDPCSFFSPLFYRTFIHNVSSLSRTYPFASQAYTPLCSETLLGYLCCVGMGVSDQGGL